MPVANISHSGSFDRRAKQLCVNATRDDPQLRRSHAEILFDVPGICSRHGDDCAGGSSSLGKVLRRSTIDVVPMRGEREWYGQFPRQLASALCCFCGEVSVKGLRSEFSKHSRELV